MKTLTLFTVCVLLFVGNATSQTNLFPTSGSAGIGTIDPNPSSLLDMVSTSKGILIPRMTKVQRDAIVSPATGLLIYQTNVNPGFFYFNGSSWTAISTQDATKQLDNLTTTAVNVTLQPGTDNSKDLGSGALSWKNLYVDGIGYLGTAKLGNFVGTPEAGMIRWTGTEFQGYNGAAWISLSGGGAGANTALSNLTTTSINQNLLPDTDGTRFLGSISKGWGELHVDGKAYLEQTILGNFVGGEVAGSIRFGLSGFEGYDGSVWKSFTEIGDLEIDSSLYAVSDLSNLAYTAVNVNLNPNFSNSRDIGQSDKTWNDIYFDGTIYAQNKSLLRRTNNGAIFIGETYNTNPLLTNNIFIGDSSGYAVNNKGANILIGASAGVEANSTGSIQIGSSSGRNNTGDGTICIGGSAGSQNTFDNNMFIGNFAGYKNTSGASNTFVGYRAGTENITGEFNTFLGNNAGANLTGNNNTALGMSAGHYAGGSDNTFIGYAAGNLSTAGGNTFVGSHSGSNNTTGFENTFLGTGTGQSTATGWGNTFVGFEAGNMGDGYANTCVGSSAGKTGGAFSGGKYNVYVGTDAGTANNDAYNVVIGSLAGNSYTGMDNCILIGYNTDVTGVNFSNSIAIGANATITSNNVIRLGNTSIARIGIGKNPSASNVMEFQSTTAKLTSGGVWTDASDRKLKQQFKTLDKNEVLEKINALEVTEWNYKADDPSIRHIGPMAQDFYALFNVGDDSTIAAMDKAGVALIGIQALSANQNEQNNKIESLEVELQNHQLQTQQLSDENAQLRARLEQLEQYLFNSQNELPITHQQSVVLSDNNQPKLWQNEPNPSTGATNIRYYIPEGVQQASIIFYNANGVMLQNVPIVEGNGQLAVDAKQISAGAYTYALVINNSVVATKQMIITK